MQRTPPRGGIGGARWTGAVAVGMALCAPAAAHETDQFTVPAGKVFADVGAELTAIYYEGIEDAVNGLNTRIRRALEARRGRTFIEYLQSTETLTDAVYDEYAPAWFMINSVERMVHTNKAMRRKHPGRVIGYSEPIHNVFTGVYHPLDARQLFRIFHACMMNAFGTYIGPDKIGHFTDMGYVYYTIRRAALAAGLTEAEAHAKVMAEGKKGLILGEEGMLGYLSAGMYSNADLSSNYAGMKFYMNLTQGVRLKGVLRPAMVVLRGDYWEISPHVRLDSDFFAWFVSDHWNEALNPGLFVPGMQDKVRRVVRMRSQRILNFYADDNGNRRTPEYFNKLVAEYSTWYGEDYGHQGTLDDVVGIGNTCFGDAAPAPGERTEIGYTRLHWGVVTNDQSMVLTELEGGTPIDEPVRSLESKSAEWGSSPLHRAIEHARIVALLIDHGADVTATDERGRTPLHWSARYTDARAVALIIDGGADVDAADHVGETPLHRAAMSGQIAFMEAVIAAGADVDARANFDATPLHFAVRGRQPASLRLLVDHDTRLDPRDEFGVTPLHDAARDGSLELVGMLLDAGADAGTSDNYGSTPLHVSARYGHDVVAAELLAHGVAVNIPNRFGSLPLHEAAFATSTPLIKLLLKSGANATARNRNGESPIDLAASGGNSVAVLIMRSSGSGGSLSRNLR